MKKLILIIGFVFAVGCVDKNPSVNNTSTGNGMMDISTYEVKESNGQSYKVYTRTGGVFIVNLTKDSLETEYYKSQINVNNKYYGHD